MCAISNVEVFSTSNFKSRCTKFGQYVKNPIGGSYPFQRLDMRNKKEYVSMRRANYKWLSDSTSDEAGRNSTRS